ncbi:hypothetical protein LTR36_008639 [Oleoguttula mirabilis]|uniref:L-type lectin-like domain-containing protein n=1 Tax=Oleoguttula mirabilis TaxID=1507867 RepID=A0AAV9JT61_9PEZI|nr:hypothetical protein LTR36_008639 [Oleoguttula mirabilis]
MRSHALVQPLSWLLFTTAASAQYVLDSLSFGHQAQLSPNGRALPGWSLSGQNHQVQLLSDRIILTPPVPGQARGAIWSDTTVPSADWTAEFEFRASGQDMGSGNLNVWYTQEKSVGTDSVYTVEKFDGLALVLDQYGSTGGKVRGFLNDGTQNFKGHSSLESLAFGQCDYAYRNLGRPSKLRISNQNGLTVSVDDRECFRTNRVSLPSGYYFGITAATADNPDSFEINKFVVSSGQPSQPQHLNQPAAREGAPPPLQKLDRFPGSPEAVPDRVADDIKNQQDQFADLHNRLQAMTHQFANLFGEFDNLGRKIDQKHKEVMGAMPAIPHDTINDLKRRTENIERMVLQIQKDVEGRDYRQHINDLQTSLDGIKGGITEHLPATLSQMISASTPRMGMFVFIVVAVQIMLAGAFVVYKRRRNGMPKKYL